MLSDTSDPKGYVKAVFLIKDSTVSKDIEVTNGVAGIRRISRF